MADWDFIGFTYNGYHSIRDLGIYRISNGNRYDDNLTATMTDKVVDVPGGDGQYYFGTTFKNRTFTVNYAFDMLSEAGIRKLKEVFCGDGIHDLVFDERPYVAWPAKVTGTASMKHLCFEEDGQRIYKGEGSITFTCYSPYGHTPKKLWTVSNAATQFPVWSYTTKDGKKLSNYTEAAYSNKNEWAVQSGLQCRCITLTNVLSDTPTIRKMGITYKNVNSHSSKQLDDFLIVIVLDKTVTLQKNTSLIWHVDEEKVYYANETIPFSYQKRATLPYSATNLEKRIGICTTIEGTEFTVSSSNIQRRVSSHDANPSDVAIPFKFTVGLTKSSTAMSSDKTMHVRKLIYSNSSVECELLLPDTTIYHNGSKSETITWDSKLGLVYKTALDEKRSPIPAITGKTTFHVPAKNDIDKTTFYFGWGASGSNLEKASDQESSYNGYTKSWYTVLDYDYLYR